MEVNSTFGRELLMVKINNQSGFTLMELMVALGISIILLASMVMAFTGQSRSYNTQQEITVLQEDIRAGLSLMTSEIRMAGYDPEGKADAKILFADANMFHFSLDINGDGDTEDENEDISYIRNANGTLERHTVIPPSPDDVQPIAENTENLAFEYLVDLDPVTWTQVPADLKKIRAVKISVLARTARQTSAITDTSAFVPPIAGAVWTPATPGKYQRRMMSVVVQCRNLQG